MKHALAIFLSFVILFSSLGVTVYFHNCPYMGSSISFNTIKASCCGPENNMPEGCCKNHSKQVNIKDAYSITKKVELNTFTSITLKTQYFDLATPSHLVKRQNVGYTSISPPGPSSPIFILYRSLLI